MPGTPRTDPGVRNYRTGLLPQVKRGSKTNSASRILSSSFYVASSRCVLVTVVCPEFPLAQGLFSTNSAGSWPIYRVEYLCSLASQILYPSPTSQERSCRTCGIHLLRPDQPRHRWSFLGSPGFRSKSLRTCTRSLTPRVQCITRDLRDAPYCLPLQATRSATRIR